MDHLPCGNKKTMSSHTGYIDLHTCIQELTSSASF
uniref:Uncharacterized protein n=1 Tax=Arundo donax TaxID=35708 RepID=A0A0A9FVT2_ARUDO